MSVSENWGCGYALVYRCLLVEVYALVAVLVIIYLKRQYDSKPPPYTSRDAAARVALWLTSADVTLPSTLPQRPSRQRCSTSYTRWGHLKTHTKPPWCNLGVGSEPRGGPQGKALFVCNPGCWIRASPPAHYVTIFASVQSSAAAAAER